MKDDRPIGPNSPLYLQLRELIRSKIENGEYLPGIAIPSVGDLARVYGIHRLSVRSAISALIGEGLLKSVQGKGIFVVGDKLEQDLETIGAFHQNISVKNKRIETCVLMKALRPAGAVYGRLLRCETQDSLYYIKQISGFDGEPISLDDIYIPEALVPNLKNVDLGVFSIHEALEFYGIRVARREQSLEITRLERMDARVLGVDSNCGVLDFRCVSYDELGRAVEYKRTYTRGDKCTFSVRYQKFRSGAHNGN
jgi:GntR family transcriptional regulator